jgi:hypothetical protein
MNRSPTAAGVGGRQWYYFLRKEIKKATAGISLPPSQAKDQKKRP